MELTGHTLRVVRNAMKDYKNDVTMVVEVLLMLDASSGIHLLIYSFLLSYNSTHSFSLSVSVEDAKPTTTTKTTPSPSSASVNTRNDDWKKNFSAADFGDGGFLLSGANRPESKHTREPVPVESNKERKLRERMEALREKNDDCPPPHHPPPPYEKVHPGNGRAEKGRRKGEKEGHSEKDRRGGRVHVLSENGEEDRGKKKKKGEQTPIERLQELR